YTVSIQALPTVIARSTGGVPSVSELMARVENQNGGVVSGVPVLFRIENPRGGGEFISPSLVYTCGNGVAKATLTAGSIVTSNLRCVAEITRKDTSKENAKVGVNIAGQASSIAIGGATKIVEKNQTQYEYPMALAVVDSNGNGVPNTDVSLSVWP